MADEIPKLLCVPWKMPSRFTDDVRAVCCRCGCHVRHRPHVPTGLAPICMDCYAVEASPQDHALVTRRTLEEVRAVLRGWLH